MVSDYKRGDLDRIQGRKPCTIRRLVRLWLRSYREVVDAPSVETFKVRLGGSEQLMEL